MPSVLSKFSRTDDEEHVQWKFAIGAAVIKDNLSEVKRIIQQNPRLVKDPLFHLDTQDLLSYAIMKGSHDCCGATYVVRPRTPCINTGLYLY